MNEKWVSALWQRMKDVYGQKWTSLFQGAEAIESWRITWGQGMAGFSAEQWSHGVSRMATAYPEWPPTLGQFRELCFIPQKPMLALPKPAERTNPFVQDKINALLKAGDKGPWRWTPDKVVNETQLRHVVEAAQRGYPPGVAFLEKCKRAGVITEDNKLAKRERIAA